jgi:hypothetical protein
MDFVQRKGSQEYGRYRAGIYRAEEALRDKNKGFQRARFEILHAGRFAGEFRDEQLSLSSRGA